MHVIGPLSPVFCPFAQSVKSLGSGQVDLGQGCQTSWSQALSFPGSSVLSEPCWSGPGCRQSPIFPPWILRINGQVCRAKLRAGSFACTRCLAAFAQGEGTLSRLLPVPLARPLAVALRLDWTDAGGWSGSSVFSNETWKSRAEKGKGRTVESFGSLSNERWWNLPPTGRRFNLDDYTQWKRASAAEAGTDPASFLHFARIRGRTCCARRARKKTPGSAWPLIPKGRITIGREDKGLLRFSSFAWMANKSSGPRASRTP